VNTLRPLKILGFALGGLIALIALRLQANRAADA
jgi:hypothetical protein